MSEDVPARLQLTRDAIQLAVDRVEACFTAGDTVADQMGRACDLVLDLSKTFGVQDRHRDEAIALKAMLNDLLSRERAGEMTTDAFLASSAQQRRRVLELTREMAGVAQRHVSRIGPPIPPRDPTPPIPDPPDPSSVVVIPHTPLGATLKKLLIEEPREPVVFRCTGVSKRYGFGSPFVICDLDLELKKGEITGVVGLNGSGKTTLLRIVAGSLESSSGKRAYPALRCRPTNWVTIRRSIAMVAQRPERWAGTVEDALLLQAACFGATGRSGRVLVEFYIARLGLTDYRHHTWGQLSGGYRTRFEVAKAMLSSPKMLVLDEPLAALDIPAQMQFLRDLKDFATDFADTMPVLLSSQHIYEVEAIAERMVVIRDGHVVYNGLTRDIGEARSVNGFELSCDLGIVAIRDVLTSRGLRSIQQIGPQETFVTMETSVTARQVIEALITANATVRHFRDTSRSSRMFLDS